MRVIALISGGKDSCYNMMQCVSDGHEIVALVNLHPKDCDELDSYMYQTVGHMGINILAEALELPLYRQETLGKSKQLGKTYTPEEHDEVEDLYKILKKSANEMNADAVSVGAIFSEYQRVRIEHVCNRLNLQMLAYLWKREQSQLLQDMIDNHVHAILIKVATLGLTPNEHLGKTLQEVQPFLLKMNNKYGINVCGEGGEYETFTLDCPLFKKRIVVDEMEIIESSDDPICPVGYMNFKKLSLHSKC